MEGDAEVIRCVTDLDPNPSKSLLVIRGAKAVHDEEVAKQVEMGTNPKKSFIKIDEDSYIGDGVGVEVH